MSHTTKLNQICIRDVGAMKQAVMALQQKGIKCNLLENTKPRMYYTEQGPTCDYVLRLDNAKHDVGFQKQKDGTYSPVLDTWGGHVKNEIGATCPMPNTPEGKAQHNIGQFMQEYSKAATVNAAIQQGYVVESTETDQNGNIHLTLAGM